ncbi:MAG TPA: hypothetical protein VK437_10960 [Steroidobacteraceae bacterium]|nr:hypothetical protein [Steroidobacteraceae bacterium]
MKYRQILKATCLLFAAWAAPWTAAHADMVVFDSMSLFQGQQAFTETFSVTTPGTLSVSLTDVPWLDSVANLSFFLSSPTGTLGRPLTGNGSELIRIAPGTYTANWFGNAEGVYNMGVVGVSVTFYPNWTPVPLPASLIVMLSGLGLLFAWPRMATEVQPRGSHTR